MSDGRYDSQSLNANLARIIARLDQQDKDSAVHRTEVKEMLTEIRTETRATNGRVTTIERWIDTLKAKVAIVVFIGSACVSLAIWIIGRIWK